ncbi:amidohydrolase family protein [Paraburkholderia sp. J63]|uniref:amidohydrolase family protein n=1 Tax=Paraburkholderia sp. J63 TaxID=2805434 RepID=UPI002ABD79A3|nr:amidohydrolase family protein [Paraburkholderia sp. J63]
MSANRVLVTGGHVITMDETSGDMPNGAVLLEGDRIAAVGPAEEFAGIDAETIDAKGNIVLPGMIDSHRHTWMALLRAISADMSLPEFLASTFYGIGSVVRADDLGTATLVGALEAIDSGVTTIMDCCDCVNSPDHAFAAVDSLKEAGIRGVYAYGFQSFDFQPPAFGAHRERLATARELHRRHFAHGDGFLRLGFLLSDFGTIAFDDTAAEIRLAKELGALVASHTGAASNSILLKGLRELNDHGLLLPGHLHIHCTALTGPEWELLAQTGAQVTISPETEMQMGMGRPPFRACLEHGITPAFSTDIVCVGSGDLFSQMRLGLQFQRCMDNECVHHTGVMPMTLDLSVRDALNWATHGSARALGMSGQVGSLTPGKQADLIILSHPRAMVPSSYPAGSAVLQTTASDVDTVIIGGKLRKRHGQLLDVDLAAVRQRAHAALERIQQAARALPPYAPDAVAQWFGRAERMASVNFAAAYAEER